MSNVFWLAVLGWVVVGILHVYFRRSLKRLRSKPPEYALSILNELPEGWQLLSYSWGDNVEWKADLGIRDRVFRLSTDQGRIGADEVVDGELKGLSPHSLVRDFDLQDASAAVN